MMKPTAEYGHFGALDIRVGTVVAVEDAGTKKPTYRMTIDFGPEIGTKISCGGYTSYSKDQLQGASVIGVINLPPKTMGPEVSEVLVLGVEKEEGKVVYLTTESSVPVGTPVF